jgi:APA family basic amino acid/polyamine antiporter
MDKKQELVRGLGIWAASSVVVGTIIGSGIFLVANTMTRGVGTPGMVFFVWVFGGLLSLSGALAYAELGAMLPEAGGEYVYLREAYGPLWGFLYGWSQFLIMKTASIATLATGFALYFTFFFPGLNIKAVALVVIALLGAVNYFGVRTGGAVQTFFTVLKVVLILALVFAALLIGGGSWANLHTAVPIQSRLSGFVVALVAALWAYDGWNNISMAGGEVADPQRNIPRALVFGTLGVGVLYVLANVAYFYILPAAQVAASQRVAGDVARKFLGEWGGRGVALAAMVSMFAAINGSILSGSRVPFAMARDGVFFPALARVHSRYHSPHVAVVAQSVLAAAMALTGRYDDLFTYVIFASWIYYGLTAAAVFQLRRQHPEWARPYRTWGYPVLPALFGAISGALVVLTLREQAWWRSLLGLGIIALGVPAYLLGRRHARRAGTVALVLLCCCLAAAPQAAAGQEAASRRQDAGGRTQEAAVDRSPASRLLPNASGLLPTASRLLPSSGHELLLFTLNETTAIESLRDHVDRGTLLSPQWFATAKGGSLSGQPSQPLLEAARARGALLTPSVINRDFTPRTAAALLKSGAARARLARQLTEKARRFGFRGYVVDFENLPADPATRKRFAQFLGELRSSFQRAHLSLTVAVPPPSARNRQAFDYRSIGRLADRVVLMAYDEHGRLSEPGPIASYSWVEAALADMVGMVAPQKLLLGVAFYHRNWGGAETTAGSYSEAAALLEQNGAGWRWHPGYRAHWFDFEQSGRRHTVWVEDASSIADKLALARRYGVAGIAGWRLGQEDPRVWPLLRQFRTD